MSAPDTSGGGGGGVSLADVLRGAPRKAAPPKKKARNAASAAAAAPPMTDAATVDATAATRVSDMAMSTTSVSEVVKARQRAWEAHTQQVRTSKERLERVGQQLHHFKRTRRNVAAYNGVLERQAALRKELALLEMQEPDLGEFYEDVRHFLKSEAPEAAAAAAAASAPLPDASAAAPTSAAAAAATTHSGPAHRFEHATAGAPVFERRHFDMLALGARAAARHGAAAGSSASFVDTDAAAGPGGTTETNGTSPDDDLFEAVLARDALAYMAAPDARPLFFWLAPTSVGLCGGGTTANKRNDGTEEEEEDGNADETILTERAQRAMAMRDALRGGGGGGTTSNKRKRAADDVGGGGGGGEEADGSLKVVTIGKAARTAAMGVENRNRLNVKMKDIRNMKNASMYNYVSVEQCETTHAERQHRDLVDFLGERERERAAVQQPAYDDPRCDACGEVLVVDVHTGMVSCPNTRCGVAYADGVDFHRVEPVRHEYHSKFEYLSSGHLMTLLKRFQAKEATVIPREIIDRVVLHLSQRDEMADISQITTKKLTKTLQHLALNRFYDHRWQLRYILTGEKPIQFSALEEQEFLAVFDVLEEVYPLFKPKSSENMPYYWHIIAKTAQLLGHPDEVVRTFPKLKNPAKHRAKEKTWKRMVTHIGWPYYETAHEEQ